MLETHDRIIEEIAAVQGHLRTADSAIRLRRYKEADSEAWEALSAEALKEASIARAGLSRVLALVAEDTAHDTDNLGRAVDAGEVPEWVNGGER